MKQEMSATSQISLITAFFSQGIVLFNVYLISQMTSRFNTNPLLKLALSFNSQ